MIARRLVIGCAASLCALVVATRPVTAHPVGNASVNRAVGVRASAELLEGVYVIDMAEIPAFAAISEMDVNGDGGVEPNEAEDFGIDRCRRSLAGLDMRLDGSPLQPRSDGTPRLSFPPGVGGLETLRLECPFQASWPVEIDASTDHRLNVNDLTDDGSLGWREVTIAAGVGIVLGESDVPAVSPSQALKRYPEGSLSSPLDVRSGSAVLRIVAGAVGSNPPPASTAGVSRGAAGDALASLAQGPSSPPLAALAMLMSLGLGAVHALSPGHGKTVVAAYLIGSRATLREAAALGVTVAASHTAGVLVLAVVTLAAGELLAPDRFIELLSVAAGALVVVLGTGLLARGVRGGARRHAHAHPHRHGPSAPADDHGDVARIRARHLAGLGLAGGMIPSASAVIVLLVAITTGQVVYGLAVVGAFGVGMAAVLAGVAVMSSWARRRLVAAASERFAERLARIGPLVSGGAVLTTGMVITVSAAARLI